ncbi:uncharacterized protein LOC130712405 [Lotus japonicus]|uniref:uncharacterized protein LOC130712405 n=1 Tax=Lotus japonicus TaxID=34305 RepID=UPI002585667C|nr:uncharacterized protein LOC130712405 [Lotus japonicus]
MAFSTRLATLISSIAFSTYFFIVIFQIPIFRVPCRMGICKTPLEVTSSQLIASEVFPLFIVKTLLYPGAFAKAICKQKSIPTYANLLKLHNFRARAMSATSDLQHLEVLAGSYLAVGGAIAGLIKPGRMSLFGILLLMWGLIMGKSGFSHDTGIHIYPAMYVVLLSAFFSIRRDVRKIIRSFNLKHIVKVKRF